MSTVRYAIAYIVLLLVCVRILDSYNSSTEPRGVRSVLLVSLLLFVVALLYVAIGGIL